MWRCDWEDRWQGPGGAALWAGKQQGRAGRQCGAGACNDARGCSHQQPVLWQLQTSQQMHPCPMLQLCHAMAALACDALHRSPVLAHTPNNACAGAHASALYKKARIRMESLSRRAAGRQASQPGSRHNLQQQLETACKDGRLAAAVARWGGRLEWAVKRSGWNNRSWAADRLHCRANPAGCLAHPRIAAPLDPNPQSFPSHSLQAE